MSKVIVKKFMISSPTQLIGVQQIPPGDSEGQGSLPCCSPGDSKELDTAWPQQQQHMCLRQEVDMELEDTLMTQNGDRCMLGGLFQANFTSF